MASYGQPGYNPQQQNPSYQPGYQYPQQQGQMPQYAGAQPPYGAPHFAEGGMPKNEFTFTNQTIRAAFIRKVFMLVTVMLGVVAVMSAIPFMHRPTMEFVRTSPGIYMLGFITFFVVYLVLMCCESVRRTYPVNLLMTAILTIAMGYMTMVICSLYDVQSVMLALIITTLCCGTIVLFAMQTKYDITSMMGFVFIASMVLMIFGLVAIVGISFFHVRWLYTVYAGLAALLFMVYLAIDIQMIMGGRKFEISPEEHIFAAIQIFIDIIYIFWMILQLFGNHN
jgi:FtsH-binding integral membrane protein